MGYDGEMLRAIVSFLSTSQDGRKGPVTTGYRGQFHFGPGDECGDLYEACMEVALVERWINPGESTDARFTFTENSTNQLRGKIKAGDHFELREGRRVVATGIVTAIENSGLG
jgi:translation elongation factor EF-Tu-like GTPase